jgi:hypothetical protein
MNTLPNTWGMPGPNATNIQKIAYSDIITTYNNLNIDVVLIDARFRVACALKAYNVISYDTIVLFDDFTIRPEYHIVLDYYDMIEHGNILAVLKKKKNVVIPLSVIHKYELIED